MVISIIKEVLIQHYVLSIVLMLLVSMIGMLSLFWLQITRRVFIEKCYQSVGNYHDENIIEKTHI